MKNFKLVVKGKKYVLVEKKVIDDISLSWGARGLYCYLISQEPKRFSLDELKKVTTDFLEDVEVFLSELKKAKLIEIEENENTKYRRK